MRTRIITKAPSVGILPAGHCTPVRVVGNENIVDGFDDTCLRQAINSRSAPGVTGFVLNPDAHAGYGAPVGSVLISPTHIYPGPVGVDIKCSMSLLQLGVYADAIRSDSTCQQIMREIERRIGIGVGRGYTDIMPGIAIAILTKGASAFVCDRLDIPNEWVERCEDAHHTGHDGSFQPLQHRLHNKLHQLNLIEKVSQLGSYGGGNHFGECEVIRINDRKRKTADSFGLKDFAVGFLSHCGSRRIGHDLAMNQFRILQDKFKAWGIPFPSDDKELVYAPLGTQEANDYLDDMAIAANFATVNHLYINKLILDAFRAVLGDIDGDLIYSISHNMARQEIIDDKPTWVHRKGATRAYPKGHFSLRDTPFYDTGHPILLPGDPISGSVVMVAEPGAAQNYFSINHGAGRTMSRTKARTCLDQNTVDQQFKASGILSNQEQYPLDESPGAYKNFDDVLDSVKQAGLASEVARLDAQFVMKGQ